ncbi:hypothetical protein D9757_006749 [Collybiopsis confluens]|uniref:Uncharacterized protein n=1 Tax=Collybiopsis confluens TaxID=2823264 RepID=A0A8H5HLH7_9AGAR|nr:hypothetical protein D9757_006749 [Collybiopsis confluens]
MSAAAALSQLYSLKMLPIPESEETTMELDDLERSASKQNGNGGEAKSEAASIHTASQIDRASSYYFDDPNLDLDIDSNFMLEDESPYPEASLQVSLSSANLIAKLQVRCAVSNVDDPNMPTSTVRAWTLGIIWAMVIPGINQFFFFRFPSVDVTGMVSILVTYPMGRLAAAYVPRWSIFGLELNPGPFTIKEHVLITIMATVGQGSAYGTDIIAVQRVFYQQTYSFAYQWFLTIATQLIGFSIGGISRHILVEPASMIWPTNLVTCALFNTLHSEHYAGIGQRGGLSRRSTFGMHSRRPLFDFFPDIYVGPFQALSYFSWVTWIWPDSPTVAQLFGYVNGLGFSVLTFDWSQIAFLGSPLATPWWAQANVIAGFIVFIWLVVPILHFKNVWYGLHMPVLSRQAYNSTMQTYEVHKILNPDATFNATKYEEYGPLYLSYALPGRPIALMIFKTLGYNTMSQALIFTSDLKLAHYMKIPPRPMFFAQVICGVLAATAQLGVQTWLFENIKRNFAWWTKYNYSGLAVSIVVIYFTLQYPQDGTASIGKNTILSWWGNTVPWTGADGLGIPVIQLPVGQKLPQVAGPLQGPTG